MSVDRELIKSIYVINKKAKEFEERSQKAYQKGDKEGASYYSQQKAQLYTLKSNLLNDIKEYTTYITIHNINGRKFYYFKFDHFSFHSPIQNHPDIQVETKDERSLSNFTKDSTNDINKSYTAALKYIHNNTPYNQYNYI